MTSVEASNQLTKTQLTSIFPAEILIHLFSFLDPASLATCALVDHEWKVYAEDERVWKVIFHRDYKVSIECGKSNWRQLYWQFSSSKIKQFIDRCQESTYPDLYDHRVRTLNGGSLFFAVKDTLMVKATPTTEAQAFETADGEITAVAVSDHAVYGGLADGMLVEWDRDTRQLSRKWESAAMSLPGHGVSQLAVVDNQLVVGFRVHLSCELQLFDLNSLKSQRIKRQQQCGWTALACSQGHLVVAGGRYLSIVSLDKPDTLRMIYPGHFNGEVKTAMAVVGDRFFMASTKSRLFRFSGDLYQRRDSSAWQVQDLQKKMLVMALLPLEGEKLLLATEAGEVFIADGDAKSCDLVCTAAFNAEGQVNPDLRELLRSVAYEPRPQLQEEVTTPNSRTGRRSRERCTIS